LEEVNTTEGPKKKISSLVIDSLCDQGKKENMAVADSNRDPPPPPARADHHQRHGRYPEAAGWQKGYPELYTRGVPRREN